MEIGKVQPKDIIEEMQESYLDYAMSVIISRALPDVRDGLKPVHRRILYSMWDSGLKAGAKFRKSAAVIGDVLAKYHPHGDMAVYDALVRMAQDFSLRYPLVQGQGNFGSMDGDSAAAYRYTEAKLSPIVEEMLFDIDKNTVNWVDNYDGVLQEPTVLPAKLPNLLLNGSMGIAVGMATNIPPHNLCEIIDGVVHLIDNKDATNDDLLKFVKGPDFPTGGVIYDKKAIGQAYSTGRGAIITRAVTDIQEVKKDTYHIIVTEIPYQVNKANLLEKIADLVKEKKIEGIRDLRDESSKEGVRVVIELKNDVAPQKILNRLFKLTDLQKAFHFNMIALVDGIQPQVLSLKNILDYYIAHRKEVITRRTQFDLNKTKDRVHILDGLKKALDHIDKIISIIRKSANKEDAQKSLISQFQFTVIQVTAILEMRLQALVGLERQKVEDELKEKLKLIAELESLLKSPKKILEIIRKELLEIREKYGDKRKTKITASAIGEFKEEDLIPEEECIVSLTQGGYIKRLNPKTYKAQKRGGKGMMGMVVREEDKVEDLLSISTHDNLLFFTNMGRVFQIKAYEIPQASRTARGQAIVNFLQTNPGENITALVGLKNKGGLKSMAGKTGYLVMGTNRGIVKKTPVEDFSNVRRSGLMAIKLNKGDELRWAALSSGSDEVMLFTAKGQSIHFKESDIRSMGRAASGVRGIRLSKNDEIRDMAIISRIGTKNQKEEILFIMENGYGKKTDVKLFKIQKRGGSGLKAAQITPKTGQIVGARLLDPSIEDLIVISSSGQVIRTILKNISNLGRATQGVRIMRLASGDKVASITCV